MNRNLIIIYLLLLTTTSFAQTSTQVDKQKVIVSKGLQAVTLLKTYIKRQNLTSSSNAVKLIDTTQQLIKELNKDSLNISQNKFSEIEESLEAIKKVDYKKFLALEKKSPKVKVRLEGEELMMSKNTFMPLYTIFRILQSEFEEWQKNL